MRLVHYGASEYSSEKFRPISDIPFMNKPSGGLWTSPLNSDWGWKDWCKAEDFGNLSQSFLVDFEGSLLKIDGYDDMLKLPWIENRGIHFVSFQALCAGGFYFDAIHLTVRGEQKTRFTFPKNLYGWDCECVLVINPDSIRAVENAQMGKVN